MPQVQDITVKSFQSSTASGVSYIRFFFEQYRPQKINNKDEVIRWSLGHKKSYNNFQDLH